MQTTSDPNSSSNEPAPQNAPTHEPPPSSPPPSGRDYRYSAQDVVEGAAADWMVGKTPVEVARMSAQLVTSASRFDTPPQPQYSTPASAQPGYPQAPSLAGPQAPDPQLMYSDPAAYQQQLFAYHNASLQAQLQSVTAPLYQQNAQTALSIAKHGKHADVWKRYEPEILGELQNVDRRLWNESLLEKAAEIVQGRHWREFVNEEAQKLAASGAGTERGGSGSGYAPSAPQGDALDEAWNSDHPFFERARATKLSKSDMRDHIRTVLKIPVDQYVKNILGEQVISSERGFTRERV